MSRIDLGPQVAVRSVNWLGDAVMTLPAVALLRASLPASAKLTILCRANLADFWACVPGADAVEVLPPSFAKVRGALAGKKFSSAVLFPNSLRSGLEAMLAGIPVRAGYAGHARKLLLTRVIERGAKPVLPEHQQWDYLRLVSAITGAEIPKVPVLPKLTTAPLDAVRDAGAYLVVCPGAEYGPAKRWPAARFAEAAQRLADERKLKIVLLGGPKDVEAAAAVEAGLKETPVCNLAGATTMKEYLSWMAGARLILCNDSGAMHLAAAARVPAVAVFGSTEPRLTGPMDACVQVVREHVPCSPCFLRECPIDFRCMESVGTDRVAAAAHRALQPATGGGA